MHPPLSEPSELTIRLPQLFLHCDVSELGCEGPIATIEADELFVESVPPTPKAGNSPRQSISVAPRLPSIDAAKSATPASPSPRSRTTTTNGTSAPSPENGANDLRSRILAYEEELDKKLSLSTGPAADNGKGAVRGSFFSSGASDSDESSDEGSALPDSNVKYAQLKLQLSEIQRSQAAHKRATKGKGDRKGAQPLKKEEEEWMEAKAEVLKSKITKVEGEYTFRKVDAEKGYREERTKLDAAQLAARLSGAALESVVPGFPSADSTSAATPDVSNGNGNGLAPAADITSSTSSTSPSVTNGSSPSSPTKSSAATEDGDGGDLFGNLLDEPATASPDGEEKAAEEEGTTIPIRDMSLPKHFSGKTPKTSLEETVRKLDKYGTVVFSVLSRSRAVRTSVTIRWSGSAGTTGEANGNAVGTGRTQTWRMEDLACRDVVQANNYIATVALFAVASSKEGSGIQANKALPTVFRDLWDELAEKRKREDEEVYRTKLKTWKAIAEPRCQEQPAKVRSEDSPLPLPPASCPLTLSSAPRRTPASSRARRPPSSRTALPVRRRSLPNSPNESSSRCSSVRVGRRTRKCSCVPLLADRRSLLFGALLIPYSPFPPMQRQRANLPIAAYRTSITSTIEENQCIVLCGETGWFVVFASLPSYLPANPFISPSAAVNRPKSPLSSSSTACAPVATPRSSARNRVESRPSRSLSASRPSWESRPTRAERGTRLLVTRSGLIRRLVRTRGSLMLRPCVYFPSFPPLESKRADPSALVQGIVLRMLEGKESLGDVTHIIIDEVHERSIDSDFLLIVLREILEVRKDLKCVLPTSSFRLPVLMFLSLLQGHPHVRHRRVRHLVLVLRPSYF